jgi:ribose transport system substrate-binding protein
MLSGEFDPYWRDVERGIAAARKHFDIELELHAPSFTGKTERDITKWQLDCAARIAADPDIKAAGAAILNYSRATEAVNIMHAAGIPVLTFDTDAPDSNRAFFIGTNNRATGSTCAYVMAKLLSFKGRIVIFAPWNNVQSCLERIAGFREVMTRYSNIEIARDAAGDENEDSIRATAEEIVAIPGLTGVFCTSGTSARINAEVLAKRGLAGQIKIVSVDVNDKIIELIRHEHIHMAIAQRPYSMGFRLMDYLYQIARHGLPNVMRGIPAGRIVDTGIHQVTKANIDNYLENVRKTEAS